MAYQALYRKFRPDSFEAVKGQEAIVTTLKNQIKSDRIAHAYLFCGTRGTGKTTAAKLFAKAVNCTDRKPDGSPCGECESCRSIASGASMSVIEIDAASNNGVDNVRQIREEVAYAPPDARFKVYIIDEVHMLSSGAFNALLKTLEEPPSYVIFILATTEPNKLPQTILSRCQRYDFHRISIDTIVERMQEITASEGIEAEERALSYIAKCANGSMRDALSLLDQCAAFFWGQTLTYDRALEVLGAVDNSVYSLFLREILSKNVGGAIKILDNVIMQGRELNVFISDFTWYLRNLLLLIMQEDRNMEDIIDVSKDTLSLLKEEARMTDANTLMRFIRIFSELSSDIRYSSDKRVLIEIAVIKLMRPEMELDLSSVLQRVSELERKLEEGAVFVSRDNPGQGGEGNSGESADDFNEDRDSEEESAKGHDSNDSGSGEGDSLDEKGAASGGNELSPALPEDIKRVPNKWNEIIKKLQYGQKAAIKLTRLIIRDDLLIIVFPAEQPYEFMNDEKSSNKEDLQAAINEVMGKNVPFRMVFEREEEAEELPDLSGINMDVEVVRDEE